MPGVTVPHAQYRTRVAEVTNPGGPHPVVLVCEHASSHIPHEFNNLGLGDELLDSHIAWDPGALPTAQALSSLLNSPLIHGTVSRLVYDLNRPPEATSAMPTLSEATVIPGNQGLSDADRSRRVAAYYTPWERHLAEFLATRRVPPILVTIHSFTPVFLGKRRDVEIGILHDRDTRLADGLLACTRDPFVLRNEPYGPKDGVTHTLKRHALPNGWLNAMIEIRNDLIATPEDCAGMALRLYGALVEALDHVSEARA